MRRSHGLLVLALVVAVAAACGAAALSGKAPPAPRATDADRADARPGAPDEEAAFRALMDAARGAPRGASCDIEAQARMLLEGHAHAECGHLDEPKGRAYEAARACVLRAVASQQAFSATWDVAGIDSRVGRGVVGWKGDASYELRWLDYDGCPSGCGDGDPHSWTSSCQSVVDMRTACRAADAGAWLTPTTDRLAWTCAQLAGRRDEGSLELFCVGRTVVSECP